MNKRRNIIEAIIVGLIFAAMMLVWSDDSNSDMTTDVDRNEVVGRWSK